MLRKSRIVLLAAVFVLAFAQVALPALTAVGPVNPANGFPLWYRDSLGQTVTLSVPPNAVSLPDPVIPGNAFSAQIGFGSEAFFWSSGADMAVPGGTALLVLALEAAFDSPDGTAANGQQMVFARVRIRVDVLIPGTYTVTHPYGAKTFTNVPAGTRAINDTVDVGLVPLVFTGALAGPIGPFLKQVGAPAGTLGDGVTLAPVTGSPTGNNFFRVVGPAVNAQTNLFTTGAQLFAGTPSNVTRATFSRTVAGAAVADLGVTIPAPVPAGLRITGILAGQPAVALNRTGTNFFARIPFVGAFNPVAVVRSAVNGADVTRTRVTLKDVVRIAVADYSLAAQTLTLTAASSDAQATLRGTGWVGAPVGGAPVTNGAATVLPGVLTPPDTVTVTSASGGTASVQVNIVP